MRRVAAGLGLRSGRAPGAADRRDLARASCAAVGDRGDASTSGRGWAVWLAGSGACVSGRAATAGAARTDGGLTVPAGSCVGTGGLPVALSKGRDNAGRMTGVCPVCGGRLRLDVDGQLPNHAPAPQLR